ncbi:hypothetical protein [Streptomyces sp. A30]|uniref:hypothetical protein n=1 Tax=Streptomyces sp. A30 TaxID=2789273 RepID=UPI0039805B5E
MTNLINERRSVQRRTQEDFDERVAVESGAFGWESVSLFILSAACLLIAILVGLRMGTWWLYIFGGVTALSLLILVARWRSKRRREMRRNRSRREE